MAIVNSPWLRGSKGKLAGMVVQGGITRGSTIIREKVDPKDPKSLGQRIQRSIMSTVGFAYGKMAEIVDHSFEGYSGKAANMNRFRSLNANMLRQYVATLEGGTPVTEIQDIYDFTPKGYNWLASNGWIMSEGSLPQIQYTFDNSLNAIDIPTDITVNTFSVGETITYETLLIGVYDGNVGGLDKYGMKAGDQITICAIRNGLRTEDGNEYGGVELSPLFAFCRIILKGRRGLDDVAFTVTGTGETVSGGTFMNDSVNELTQLNGWNVSLVVKEGKFVLRFSQPLNTDLWVRNGLSAATAILSRKVNNKWLRSQATMSFRRGTTSPKRVMFSLGEAVWRDQYSINTGENDKYLNNAQG